MRITLVQKVKLIGVAPDSKEYKRISRRVRSMEKRGYLFLPGTVVTPTTNLYEVSSYVVQSTGDVISGTERLKQERQIASRKGWETRRRNALRNDEISQQDRLHMADELGSVLSEIFRKIDTWQPKEVWQKDKGKRVNSQTFEEVKKRDKNRLKAWLELAVSREGREAVAARAQANAEEVNLLAEQILYGNSGSATDNNYMQGEIARLSEILLGRRLNDAQKIELEEQLESFMPA